jgi:hypothetical protein
MRRLLLCLPLCFLPVACAPTSPSSTKEEPPAQSQVVDDGKALPKEDAMVRLARTDPIAFLEACLRRYDREVKSYRCGLVMQERINGTLRPREEVVCDFREQPFSVRVAWRKGAGEAQSILYVKGENNDKVLAVPAGWRSVFGVVTRDPASKQVRDSVRYPPTEFGIRHGTRRTLDAWLAARKRGDLEVRYLGEQQVREGGDRTCWVLKRTGYKKAEDDGVLESTFYFDKETWLQVGIVLTGSEGQLIASYFFRGLELNPKVPPDTFTREGLNR